jgi:hypothetical protein
MSIPHDIHDVTSEGQAGQNDVGIAAETAAQIPVRPLLVSGLVVSKAALIETLRTYVPQLNDIAPIGDDRFELTIGPAEPTMEPRNA